MELLKHMFRCFLLACLVLLSPLPGVAVDLPPEKEVIAQQIFISTMSPFCVARSLQDCPSSAAQDLKEKIRGDLAAGKTKEQITQELLATFGDKVRSVPAAEGFGLLGWLAPLGFLILGGTALLVWVRMRAANANQAATPVAADIDPEMQKRIDEEVSKF